LDKQPVYLSLNALDFVIVVIKLFCVGQLGCVWLFAIVIYLCTMTRTSHLFKD